MNSVDGFCIGVEEEKKNFQFSWLRIYIPGLSEDLSWSSNERMSQTSQLAFCTDVGKPGGFGTNSESFGMCRGLEKETPECV